MLKFQILSSPRDWPISTTPFHFGQSRRLEWLADSMINPAVSIITELPAENVSLEETAASILGQSLREWEWIIVSRGVNGGTDGSVPADPRVRIVSGSTEEALESARAPMVVHLECGQVLKPAALEKLWWFLETHPEYSIAQSYPAENGGRLSMLRKHQRGSRVGTIPEFLTGKPSASRYWAADHRGQRRLLMLAPHLEIGGVDKFNLDLIEILQREHAYQVSVVTTRSSVHRWREHFDRLTPDVFTLHTFLPVEDYRRFLSYFIESRKPDTVLITNSRIAYELLPLLRTAGGASFVDYLHMEDWDEQGFPRVSLRYAAYLDCTIVSSQYLKKRLEEAGSDPNQIHVCTTNIDPQLWDRSAYDLPAIREKYGVKGGVPLIAFAARLTRQKQPDVMAAALKALRDRGLEFTSLVAGAGDYRRWLEKFIAQHGLDQVKLLGAVPSEEVREILAISDVYFLPSQNEGIALTLFEAMSMAVPTVAADVGGQAELVSPDCGILIQPGDSQIAEYADALQRILIDPELRASMGSRSRERICAGFTLHEMGNRMAQLFECAARNSGFKSDATPMARNSVPPSRVRGHFATAAFLFSPRNAGLKFRNLVLLLRILLDSGKRARLLETFDARYYLSHNPDLKARGIAPLLHYALQGYLEDRLPSPFFDATGGERSVPGRAVNPLLWSIVQDRSLTVAAR